MLSPEDYVVERVNHTYMCSVFDVACARTTVPTLQFSSKYSFGLILNPPARV